MGFLRVPNLVPWLIFNVIILGIRAWFFTDQFCWSDQTLLWLGREVIKEVEEGKRGGRGGGDYFKYIFLKGAIILVRRIIEGRLSFEKCSMCSARLELLFFSKRVNGEQHSLIFYVKFPIKRWSIYFRCVDEGAKFVFWFRGWFTSFLFGTFLFCNCCAGDF